MGQISSNLDSESPSQQKGEITVLLSAAFLTLPPSHVLALHASLVTETERPEGLQD